MGLHYQERVLGSHELLTILGVEVIAVLALELVIAPMLMLRFTVIQRVQILPESFDVASCHKSERNAFAPNHTHLGSAGYALALLGLVSEVFTRPQ